jgi:hypothetical protein
VQIRQKTWPPCDFENSDWSIFKKPLHKNRWRDSIGKQVVNCIIRVYGIKYKIFHEQVLIKSSRNEILVLSIYIRILVPNFPSTTAWDHTSDPSSKSAMSLFKSLVFITGLWSDCPWWGSVGGC